MRTLALLPLAALASACLRIGPAPPPRVPLEQQAWWQQLSALCGGAFPGRLVEQGSADARYGREPLAARVSCPGRDTVEIGFDLGSERTRSWRVARTPRGLRLTHLHSDADGTAAAPTGYGGTTAGAGTARRQDFPADSATVRMLPPAAGNVWSLEIDPGRTLAYTLGRPGVNRRFRVEFDLARRP